MKFLNAVYKKDDEYTDLSGRVFLTAKWYDAEDIQVGTEITPKERA
ncbi:MAG TPA: hypothetical protein VFX97_16745 [Pyrinomonadaceae bacterium]|nr:hypothetical protein [Pyrinomonadaceae bacterium]